MTEQQTPAVDILAICAHEAVRTAMQDAWNTICADTGCHPLDIKRQGKELYFEPRHWADLVAKLLLRNAIKLHSNKGASTREVSGGIK